MMMSRERPEKNTVVVLRLGSGNTFVTVLADLVNVFFFFFRFFFLPTPLDRAKNKFCKVAKES